MSNDELTLFLGQRGYFCKKNIKLKWWERMRLQSSNQLETLSSYVTATMSYQKKYSMRLIKISPKVELFERI
jgi:hypothetical protein